MSHKNTLFTGQPIFSQILQLIPRSLVGRLSSRHQSDRYVKTFKSWDHMVSMLYQGFFQCLSLRELITGLQANSGRLRHLGLNNTPRRSTLADANIRRPAAFFEDLYHAVYALHCKSLPDSRPIDRKMFIIDSTTISLFSNIMHGAGSYKLDGRKKGGAKAHVLLDAEHNIPSFVRITESKHHDLVFLQNLPIPADSVLVFDMAYINYLKFTEWEKDHITWVTREKVDAYYVITDRNPIDDTSLAAGVLEDHGIILGRPSNERNTPMVAARRIVFKDEASGKTFIFLTNNKTLQAQEVAAIYKRRWQIELLFKRIKQRYPLKYFLGETENAIRIQIWAALLCDLLVQIIFNTVNTLRQTKWSYANLAAMIKHHLMTYLKLIPFLVHPDRIILQNKKTGYKTGTLFDAQGALF